LDAFIDSLLDISSKVLVLEAGKRPKAEVHEIEGEYLEEGDFGISLSMVIRVLVEGPEAKLPSQFLQLLHIYLDVFGTADDEGRC
jgi:hypothetical protein